LEARWAAEFAGRPTGRLAHGSAF